MLPGTLAQRAGVRTTTYRQDFPYIGLPLRTEVRTASGKLLRAAQNTWRQGNGVRSHNAHRGRKGSDHPNSTPAEAIRRSCNLTSGLLVLFNDCY